MDTILRTENLVKKYRTEAGELIALKDVNLAVANGEFVAVMGPSGCGKSTLLHILGGLDSPTSGNVYISGQQIDNMGEARRAVLRRRQIGIVFQAFNLIGKLSVEDNIELPGLMAGYSLGDIRARRETLLREFGIADKAKSAPAQLSGGQQQRVALARALINQPAVLLADEPTGNLDSGSTDDVLKLLKQYHTRGQTILMVTHDPNVASVAERIIYMRDGSIRNEIHLQSGRDPQLALASLIELEM